MEHIIDELESIISDLDYGDITRNKATDRLDGIITELKEIESESED